MAHDAFTEACGAAGGWSVAFVQDEWVAMLRSVLKNAKSSVLTSSGNWQRCFRGKTRAARVQSVQSKMVAGVDMRKNTIFNVF